METAGQRFLTGIRPCIEMWKSIDIRVQAAHDPRIGWRCECLRVVLGSAKKPKIWRDLPRGEDILAAHEVLPIDRLPEVIAYLEAGEIPIASERIMVKEFAGNDVWRPVANFYRQTYNREEAHARFGFDYKSVVLTGYTTMQVTQDSQEVRDRLDARLQDSDPPWNGVPHIRGSFIGLPPADAERRDLAWLELVAPLLLRFGPRTTFTATQLVIEAEAASTVDTGSVRGSVFFNYGDEIVHSRRVTFGRTNGGRGKLVGRVEVPGPCSGATCLLIYRGTVTDRKQVFRTEFLGEDPRWSGFRALVGGPEELRKALRQAEAGDPLEHAVGTLFHLLGFATAHFGQNTFHSAKGTTDILAFSRDGEICLVIEGTAGVLDVSGKVGKLATRARAVERTHPGTIVQAVFVTRQARGEITETPRKVAADERVAVVTSDDFDGLVQLATEIPSPAKVREHLLRLVPTPESPGTPQPYRLG